MKFSLANRRGVLFGVAAAVIAFAASLVALTMLHWFLRPFVWAAVYEVPYSPPPGPYSPDSGEWLFVQAIAFLSAASAGFAGAKWAGASSRRLIWVLALALFLLAAFGVPHTSLVRQVVYMLGMPLGILCGALLFRRGEARISEAAAA
jgi:hypothetical protein